jgi:hypothetical protein
VRQILVLMAVGVVLIAGGVSGQPNDPSAQIQSCQQEPRPEMPAFRSRVTLDPLDVSRAPCALARSDCVRRGGLAQPATARRIGGRDPYVSVLQSHSSGPNLKRANQRLATATTTTHTASTMSTWPLLETCPYRPRP